MPTLKTGRRKKTTQGFIAHSKSIWGQKFTYEKTIYVANDKKLTITCVIHGDVQVLPQKHTGIRREECKYCKGFVPKVEELTQDYLRQWFEYNENTGAFMNRGSKESIGSNDNGYIRAKIQGTRYMVHRLIFLYMTGKIPEVVDHKDFDRMNNRWNNLRQADFIINNLNKDFVPEVKLDVNGKYWTSITYNGLLHNVGPSETKEDAIYSNNFHRQRFINEQELKLKVDEDIV